MFIIDNFGNNTHKTESKSIDRDCPATKKPNSNGDSSVLTVASNVARIIPCTEIEKSSPVQRAIIIYYPHHQSDSFFPEVRW